MTATPDGGAPAGAPAPVCPRHPSRVAYVRCQRCERPTCPECQRVAAVGFQCVDCVREGAKTVRGARTVLGGPVTDGRPLVTWWLLGVTVTAFVLQLAGGRAVTSALLFFPPLAVAEPWRFVTSVFLHSPTFLLHIAFNMYALWVVGPYLENLLGRARFLALYLLCGVGGSVGYFLLAVPGDAPGSSWTTGALGASGAVFGLWAALIVLNRRLGRDVSGITAVIVINGVLGFFIGGIAWQAHLGGLLTGALTAALLAAVPRARRALLQPAALAGVAVLLVVLVAVKVATVPAGLLA